MIAQLTGVLEQKSADRVIVGVNGVGYEVLIPFSTYYELGEPGDKVKLQIYTHVREDVLSLYGFRTLREKRVFMQLIQVSGIGPRLGVTILSGLPVDEFLAAVASEDVVRLSSIPGVGKKTAQRIALEMKDKVPALSEGIGFEPAGVVGALQRDLVSALVNLGYPKNKAESVISKVTREEGGEQFDVLLRKALKEFSG